MYFNLNTLLPDYAGKGGVGGPNGVWGFARYELGGDELGN